jgi:polyferredoxin
VRNYNFGCVFRAFTLPLLMQINSSWSNSYSILIVSLERSFCPKNCSLNHLGSIFRSISSFSSPWTSWEPSILTSFLLFYWLYLLILMC